MKELVKRLLDRAGDFFLESVTHKVSLSSQVAQHAIFTQYRTMAQRGEPLPPILETGYRVFSQTDEDGILVFIFAVIGIKRGIFIDIGGADGRSGSNCANLAINFGWHGLFIDGSRGEIEKGQKYYATHPDTWAYPPKFVCARITRENVDEVIREAGFEGEVDLLSIDIDGNDYWVWDAVTCIHPKVVLVETHIEFGLRSIVVPYDKDYAYPGIHPQYHGASPVAMSKLANRLGYRLVGANRYGWNTIYVRNGISDDILPEIPVESVLKHPFVQERQCLFESVKDYAYLEI